MTTALNVSAAPIQPFAIGGNALQMGPVNMQEIVGSQGPESLSSYNSRSALSTLAVRAWPAGDGYFAGWHSRGWLGQ